MSTLKVNKLRDTAGSADAIVLDPNGGAVLAGVTTVTSVKVGAAVTISESGIEATGVGITCANINGTQIGGRRNMIINGAMQIAQRATSVSVSDSVRGFQTLDRFEYNKHGTLTNVMTMEQSSDSPDGFSNSLKFSTTTADASLTDGQSNYLTTELEGQDVQQLAYGTSSAKSFTLSFYVKGTITGTYVVWFYAPDTGKALTKYYTISSANTWERKIITVAGDTATAIANDNGSGLMVRWILSAGPDYSSGTASTTWATAGLTNANRYVGQTANVAATTSDNWALTGVQLEVGSQATAFEHRSLAEELALCQRYFYVHTEGLNKAIGTGTYWTDTSVFCPVFFPVKMRTAPTMTVANDGSTNYYHWNRNGGTNAEKGDNWSLAISGTQGAEIYDPAASGTAGYSCFGRSADASGKISFNSEL